MILSAGLTPAWQQILVFDRFRLGEVNRARHAVWCSSGKVFNAGIAVHHLLAGDCPNFRLTKMGLSPSAVPSLTLATVGGPPLGQIDRELAELGVPRRWVVTESATRICTTILDRGTGSITELVENGRPLAPRELDEFRAAYAEEAARAEVAILIGSLPSGVPISLYRDLVQRTPCPAVLDFRGEGLLATLDLKPHVVKPNREELAQTVGHPLDNDGQLQEAMRELNRRGAAWVVVTQGAGPVWVSSAARVCRLFPPAADDVVNPIGCGDAMAAAIAWGVQQGCEMVEAVRLGIAAAGENLRQLLPCRLDPVRVRQQALQVRVEEL